jgi:LPPG:FO 2-phospho-L-lactate transferase
MKVVALAGGVGGAKLAHGLYRALGPNELTVVVNTGDDFDLYGLRIMPDADTVLYTLAGLANSETGWGVAGDTFETLSMIDRYGGESWFRLGDRDFATHILRTQMLRAGRTPTEALAYFTEVTGVRARLLPMCDEPVATILQTEDGELAFQDYFVRRRHGDPIRGVRFAGIEAARIPDGVAHAITEADVIVFCPSNPVVSIGPILAVPGLRDLLRGTRVPRIAVSPIVGGKALKGPADAMLQGLGYESSAETVARLFSDVLDGIVIDVEDAERREAIQSLPLEVAVTDTIMRDESERERLAREVLRFGEILSSSTKSTRREDAAQ